MHTRIEHSCLAGRKRLRGGGDVVKAVVLRITRLANARCRRDVGVARDGRTTDAMRVNMKCLKVRKSGTR